MQLSNPGRALNREFVPVAESIKKHSCIVLLLFTEKGNPPPQPALKKCTERRSNELLKCYKHFGHPRTGHFDVREAASMSYWHNCTFSGGIGVVNILSRQVYDSHIGYHNK